MSFPITSNAERAVYTDPPNVITVPANTATYIFKNTQKLFGTISQRLLQNTGANPCFYSENLEDVTNAVPICDDTLNYHGLLNAGQQLDCSNHLQCVCVFSPLGTTISTTIRRRDN